MEHTMTAARDPARNRFHVRLIVNFTSLWFGSFPSFDRLQIGLPSPYCIQLSFWCCYLSKGPPSFLLCHFGSASNMKDRPPLSFRQKKTARQDVACRTASFHFFRILRYGFQRQVLRDGKGGDIGSGIHGAAVLVLPLRHAGALWE